MKGFGICCMCAQEHLKQFQMLDKAQRVRNFSLELHLEVPGSMAEPAMRTLEWNVEAHKDGKLGYLLSKPIISTTPHICRSKFL